MRLDKYLSDMGLGTRSETKKSIRSGRVSVDDRVIRDPACPVGTNACVFFDGQPVIYRQFEYYMLNKPAGVISATGDSRQKTVIDLLPDGVRRDMFPVGRLDKDTVGLLLLTNDGGLAHRLLSPKSHVPKTYFARVSGELTDMDVYTFEKGILLDGSFRTLPARLKLLSCRVTVSEAEITIHEGKFHQIKRMFHAVGKEVLYLRRISMGSLRLDESLPEGSCRPLTDEELNHLLQYR